MAKTCDVLRSSEVDCVVSRHDNAIQKDGTVKPAVAEFRPDGAREPDSERLARSGILHERSVPFLDGVLREGGAFRMLDSELKVNRFLMGYLRMLIADVPDERMAEQPVAGVNHPAWILGHLAYSADRGRWLLGLNRECPAEWTEMFGPGSKP